MLVWYYLLYLVTDCICGLLLLMYNGGLLSQRCLLWVAWAACSVVEFVVVYARWVL